MRRISVLLFLFLCLYSLPVTAQPEIDITNHAAVQQQLLDTIIRQGRLDVPLIEAMGNSEDSLYIAPLLDLGFFTRTEGPDNPVFRSLQQLTDLPGTSDWTAYFVWASENDIALPPDYDLFKGQLYAALLDPRFQTFFDGVQQTANINLLEVVWGGVTVDGIPSLVNARQITPAEAAEEGERLSQFCREDDCSYPATDELVFGVYLDGDARAYPLRLLNWHEMFNDVIGHSEMIAEPGGETVCNFRAGSVFQALAYDGEFVQITGESAGCPEQGWVSADAVDWHDMDWAEAQETLPDAGAGVAPLSPEQGLDAQIKGRPVMLAYCTLCGAGILYDVSLPELSYTDRQGEQVNLGETVLEFGSTGMLMRSNKLMYDRLTNTVWNALTGIPAFGPLANSGIELPLLPVVVTDWASWLAEHPETSVLSLETGYRRDYTNGGAYESYFNNPDFVMFPVWQQDESVLANKDMIFALDFDGEQKAYPLADIVGASVVNDRVGEKDVVLVVRATPDRDFFEPGGAAVRAYDRQGMVFSPGPDADTLIDSGDQIWQVTEDALIGPDEQTLARLPGHLAFWFGWYAFYPDTVVYNQ